MQTRTCYATRSGPKQFVPVVVVWFCGWFLIVEERFVDPVMRGFCFANALAVCFVWIVQYESCLHNFERFIGRNGVMVYGFVQIAIPQSGSGLLIMKGKEKKEKYRLISAGTGDIRGGYDCLGEPETSWTGDACRQS